MRLRRAAALLVSVTAVAAGLGIPAAQAANHPEGMQIRAGAAHGHVPARAARAANRHSNVNMLWHNGAIMTTSHVQPIYWGTSWGASSFVGDKQTGLNAFYAGYSNSGYAKTSDEYTGSNGQVGPANSVTADVVDTTAAPSRAPSTTAVLGEVAKYFPNPDPSGYYAVYVDTKRGNTGYCAWHSAGTINGQPVTFAFFFNLDGDPGCDPGNNVSGHSQGLAALANVSAHELSEARTDPANGGWYDSSGAENGDKCAWTFNVPSVKFSNGSQWTLQGEWSNGAYTAGTGYPNNSGQRGCLDGH
jgi:hypothetical protein